MFKYALPLVVASSLLLNSCAEKKEEEKKEEKKGDEKEVRLHSSDPALTALTPNMLADFAISGMVTEMNCVASIKKILSAMVGVTEIVIDFNQEKDVNHAIVKYNDQKVNDQEMVSAIEKLNDGAYKVETVDIRKLDEKVTAQKKKNEEAEITAADAVSSGSGGFALPGILDVFDVL